MRIDAKGPIATIRFLGASLLALVGFPITGVAATYFVAPPPQGSDANPGSSGSPWATLQMAADSVQPGDTVLVRAGQYAGAQFTTSGTESLPISLKAYESELVEIVQDNPVTPDGINLEGASWMVVEGLVVSGRGRAGIRAVLCDHVTLRGNRLDANQKWGIFTGFCDDLLIEGNDCSNSIVEHGIYVSNSGDRPTVRRNTIWGNHANGIHMNGDVSQGGDGIISGALISENSIFGNGVGGGSGINLDGVQDSVVVNNLIYDTHASGISLYRIDGGGSSTGNRVLHNTVIVASDGRWALNVSDGSTNNTVINNVFYSYHGFRGGVSIDSDSLAGLYSDANAVEDRFTVDGGDTVMTLAEWQNLTGEDSSSVTATPEELFVDPAAENFELLVGSPAADTGEVLSEVGHDRTGRPRPIGEGFDIGGHEGVEVIFADGFDANGASYWTVAQP